MAEIQTIEGTCEEFQENLESFSKEQRFRLIPTEHPPDDDLNDMDALCLTELSKAMTGENDEHS